jgi:hypothetical protein
LDRVLEGRNQEVQNLPAIGIDHVLFAGEENLDPKLDLGVLPQFLVGEQVLDARHQRFLIIRLGEVVVSFGVQAAYDILRV